MTVLDFEKPIMELEGKLSELKHLSSAGDLNLLDEVERCEKKIQKLLHDTYDSLTPWQKVQVARHPDRPHALRYIDRLISDFMPLCGDRVFGEDAAIIGGIGRFRGHSVVVMGHEKGHDTETRLRHNFGMPRPEGYRKAVRLFDLANRFNLPVLTFVDTAGAHPGLDAEERGQSEAIARSIEASLLLKTPFISVITGEGGSGGAIALATANRILMLENSVYSVISPEGCASILWRTNAKKEEAAAAQKLTAQDLLQFKIIDGIIPEPLGGAHRNPLATIDNVGDAIENHLRPFLGLSPEDILEKRRLKFLAMTRS